MFNDGELVQTVTHKLTDLYASEDDYDPASGRRTFAEYRGDSLTSNPRKASAAPKSRRAPATSTSSADTAAQKSGSARAAGRPGAPLVLRHAPQSLRAVTLYFMGAYAPHKTAPQRRPYGS